MRKLLLRIYPFSSVIIHLFGALIIGSALIPSYFFMFWIWTTTGKLSSQIYPGIIRSFGIGISYFIFINCLLLTIIFYRYVFQLKNQEIKTQIISSTGLRLGAYNWMLSLAIHLALPLVKTTPLMVWFYRGMGAKIGRNTIISTPRLWDCDLLEIGDNCVIGGNVAISCHITSSLGRGMLKKVKIGNRVTIGADSMIFPGVTIGDNVVVAAGSIVPQDSILESHSIYSGVPVEKIR